MSEKDIHLIDEFVTVIPIGGFRIKEDDICVKTDTDMMLFLKETQLKKR